MDEQAPLPGGWGWEEAELRAGAHRVADLAADHLTTVPRRPVFAPVPVELADRWRGWQWPAQGMSPQQLLTVIQQDVLSYPFGNGHPRFHAWVNSPPDRVGLRASASTRP